MEGMHGGHRERMRGKYRRGGLEVLAEHEVLEMLLYYPIKRVNVNGTAHRLLEEKRLRDLVRQSEEELTEQEGIGEKTAVFLRLAGAAAERYAQIRIVRGLKVGTYGASSGLARRLLEEEKEECLIMMCLNAQCRLQGIETLARGETGEEAIDGRQVAEAVTRYQAHSVILANNHIEGECKPRLEDLMATQKIANILASIDVRLWDQILVSGGKTLGLNKSGYFDGIEQESREEGANGETIAADAGKYKKNDKETRKERERGEVKEREWMYDPYIEEQSYG